MNPSTTPSLNPSVAPSSAQPSSSPTKFVPDLDAIYSIDIEVEYLCGNKTTGELPFEQKLILENAMRNITSEYNNQTEVNVNAANLIDFQQADCCKDGDCSFISNRRHLQRRRLRTPIKFLVPVKCYSKKSCPDKILPVGDRRRLRKLLSHLTPEGINRRTIITFNSFFLSYVQPKIANWTIMNSELIDENVTEADACVVGNYTCDIETTCCGVNDDCYCAVSSESYCTLNRCELRGQDCCMYEVCYESDAFARTSSPTHFPSSSPTSKTSWMTPYPSFETSSTHSVAPSKSMIPSSGKNPSIIPSSRPSAKFTDTPSISHIR